jgi:ribosome-associated translation inhibitor RaiA
MQIPLQIAARSVELSPSDRALIRRRTRKLESLHPRITACRVLVDTPQRRRRESRDFVVHIDLAFPGGRVVVKRQPEPALTTAIQEAFQAAERRLADFKTRRDARRRSGAAGTMALLLLAGATAGCGVMLNGFSQDIEVVTDPPGAEVWTRESTLQYWTPTSMQLSRKRAHALRIELPGYSTETVEIRRHLQPALLVLDILATGPVGVIVDGLTGAWNALTPADTRLTLRKIAPHLAGPDSVQVRLRTRPPRLEVVSSAPGVTVHRVSLGEP